MRAFSLEPDPSARARVMMAGAQLISFLRSLTGEMGKWARRCFFPCGECGPTPLGTATAPVSGRPVAHGLPVADATPIPVPIATSHGLQVAAAAPLAASGLPKASAVPVV